MPMFNYTNEAEIHPCVRIEDIADELAEVFEVAEPVFTAKRWRASVTRIGEQDERFQIIMGEGLAMINLWINEGDGLGIGMPCDSMEQAVNYIREHF